MAANKHWLYYAYLALADRGGMTEPQGRELLKQTFPTFSHMVDSVVANHGDRSKLNEEFNWKTDEVADGAERDVNAQNMNAIIRGSIHRKENANSGSPKDMNAAIRGALSKNRVMVEQ
jgi:hypothetical protein